jgi:hypothetical protein
MPPRKTRNANDNKPDAKPLQRSAWVSVASCSPDGRRS